MIARATGLQGYTVNPKVRALSRLLAFGEKLDRIERYKIVKKINQSRESKRGSLAGSPGDSEDDSNGEEEPKTVMEQENREGFKPKINPVSHSRTTSLGIHSGWTD